MNGMKLTLGGGSAVGAGGGGDSGGWMQTVRVPVLSVASRQHLMFTLNVKC